MSGSRCILVTGASRGLGLSLTRHFLERGDQVVGCARSGSALSDPHYTHVEADVADEAAVQRVFDVIRTTCGRLDAVVNNAGAAGMNPVALTTAAGARRIVETNLLGTFLVTRSAIRLLRTSGSGRIVNVTSIAVPLCLEGEAIYAAAKSAVETLTRVTAREVAPFGITCNAVGPSPMKTALTEGVSEETMQRLIARQAVPRWAEPSDVINVVEFFLHPGSGMVTGQVVYLGGVG